MKPMLLSHVWRVLLLPALLTSSPLRAQDDEASAGPRSVSPNKHWEYRLLPNPANSGEEVPVIVKAGTTEVVLKLDEEAANAFLRNAHVAWAPDSRRLAFNYRAGSRLRHGGVLSVGGGSLETAAFT